MRGGGGITGPLDDHCKIFLSLEVNINDVASWMAPLDFPRYPSSEIFPIDPLSSGRSAKACVESSVLHRVVICIEMSVFIQKRTGFQMTKFSQTCKCTCNLTLIRR